jgi:anti-sigma regulatory factor (Ser/Thr protein kinase)
MTIANERFEITNGKLTVEDVPDVRRFIEKLHRTASNPDDIERVAMATHELLENAVKFSTDGSASLCVEVGGSQVTIVTRNRAKTDDLQELYKIGRDLAEALDPMLFYLEQMRHSHRAGGLGLGRVAAEGQMKIEVILDGDVVQIRAEATLGARQE